MGVGRKGQITIFIVLGITLLIGSGIYFYASSAEKTDTINTDLKLDSSIIENYIESCIQMSSVNGAYLLASKGGYIYYYDKEFMTEKENIAYHLEYNKEIYPKKEYMESELSRFVLESLYLCLKDFDTQSYDSLEFGSAKATTSINAKTIRVDVLFPIKYKTGNSMKSASKFAKEIPIRLGHILEVRNDLITNLKKDINDDLDKATSYDCEIDMLTFDEENTIYTIYDSKSSIEKNPFIFKFGVKNNFVANNPPKVEDVEEISAYVGKPFYMKLDVRDKEKDTITFKAETTLFDIGETTGEIEFTPQPSEVGLYNIPIYVFDGTNTIKKIIKTNISE